MVVEYNISIVDQLYISKLVSVLYELLRTIREANSGKDASGNCVKRYRGIPLATAVAAFAGKARRRQNYFLRKKDLMNSGNANEYSGLPQNFPS
jgi:hypothetical protein